METDQIAKWADDLVRAHGEAQRGRIERGLRQAASLWRPEDGAPEALAAFAREHFISDAALLDGTFQHLEQAFEAVDGHLNEVARELRRYSDLDIGPILPVDRIFAGYDPWAHVTEDFFSNRTAFLVLLNFPLTTLSERQEKGKTWSRRQWAEARLTRRFSTRIPAAVNQAIARASAAGDAYIAEYNIWMHHLLDEEGRRLFPSGLRLISHWNLRDELKADYAEPGGIAKQRMIAKVMERIVTQTIPRAVINNPRVDWAPFSNKVRPAPADTVEAAAPAAAASAPLDDAPEPNTRYEHLLATFHAARQADPHSPAAPTHIARRFDEHREMPEARVTKLLEDVLTSPFVPRVAKLIEARLGRKLEPFDIWYSGFKPREKMEEKELDRLAAARYPDAAAFQADIPRILTGLGFKPERAAYLAERIVVDPSRGAGHAMPAMRRGDKPRLRTRVEKGGMNYKGYNIAIHELGHNVEQVFSLYDVDHTLLASVPNNSFTEALAFVFQARDLELLGLGKRDPASDALRTLHTFWMTFEIAGPAMVDIAAWHWMYDHPRATPAELRDAVMQISKDLWNRHYAPVLGGKDSVLLGIYSHMVSLMMYLPDYPLGHLIEFQIEEHLAGGKGLGEEFERMTRFGSVAPDLWMENATGSPVSVEPLLRATEKALGEAQRG
ncbi:MAG TPA: hypothetical protein VMT52_07465 [Planctomycetota bacterium]|nr:hypothetical protein [Planctomycetota bacterium]